MYCGRCGAELPDEAKFCATCGASIDGYLDEATSEEMSQEGRRFCAHCGTQRKPGASYCMNCGSMLLDEEEVTISEPDGNDSTDKRIIKEGDKVESSQEQLSNIHTASVPADGIPHTSNVVKEQLEKSTEAASKKKLNWKIIIAIVGVAVVAIFVAIGIMSGEDSSMKKDEFFAILSQYDYWTDNYVHDVISVENNGVIRYDHIDITDALKYSLSSYEDGTYVTKQITLQPYETSPGDPSFPVVLHYVTQGDNAPYLSLTVNNVNMGELYPHNGEIPEPRLGITYLDIEGGKAPIKRPTIEEPTESATQEESNKVDESIDNNVSSESDSQEGNENSTETETFKGISSAYDYEGEYLSITSADDFYLSALNSETLQFSSLYEDELYGFDGNEFTLTEREYDTATAVDFYGNQYYLSDGYIEAHFTDGTTMSFEIVK